MLKKHRVLKSQQINQDERNICVLFSYHYHHKNFTATDALGNILARKHGQVQVHQQLP